MYFFFNKIFQYILGYKNYGIQDIKVVFEVLDDEPVEPGSFWRTMKLEKGTVQTVSVRGRNWRPVPKNIRIHVVLVDYWYNGRVYTHIPEPDDETWPPKQTKGLSFGEIPIRSAFLCDENDRILFDVTEIVKKFGGPKCDYSFLKRIHKLKLVNILGIQSSILAAK